MWTSAHGGYYVATDYDEVFEAARSDQVFSSARSPAGRRSGDRHPKVPVHLHIPVELDPPRSRPYREILNPMTSPDAIQALLPMIQAYTTWFIDQVIEDGECDFASVIGVPAVVTLDWLGLDTSEWRRYSSALHAVLANVPGSPEHARAVEVDLPWITEQIRSAVADRRRHPTDDLISWIVAAEIDGAPHLRRRRLLHGRAAHLRRRRHHGISLVSQALVHLARHPDQLAAAARRPVAHGTGRRGVSARVLPTQALARTVTRDVMLADCPLRPGDRVLLAGFGEPWTRPPSRPRCRRHPPLAEPARRFRHRRASLRRRPPGPAMARELLGQVLRRMPDYEVDLDVVQSYPSQGVNAGFQRIPARFTPGPRQGSAVQPADRRRTMRIGIHLSDVPADLPAARNSPISAGSWRPRKGTAAPTSASASTSCTATCAGCSRSPCWRGWPPTSSRT